MRILGLVSLALLAACGHDPNAWMMTPGQLQHALDSMTLIECQSRERTALTQYRGQPYERSLHVMECFKALEQK